MTQSHRKTGFAMTLETGAHQLVADVLPKLGGKDEGPSPHELLEAALAACTSITLQMVADRKGWNLTSCDTTVKFTKEDKEGIVIERIIDLQGELDAEQKKRLFDIAEKCPIHEVLIRGAKIESKLSG